MKVINEALKITEDSGSYQSQTTLPPLTTEQVALQARQAIQPEIDKLKSEINDAKKEFIVILGIFASIITFVSVEFQIIKTIDSLGNFIVVTLLLLGSMFIFAIALKSFVVTDIAWEDFTQKPLLIIGLALIVGSISLYIALSIYKITVAKKTYLNRDYYVELRTKD